jgi:hypothetical protein
MFFRSGAGPVGQPRADGDEKNFVTQTEEGKARGGPAVCLREGGFSKKRE